MTANPVWTDRLQLTSHLVHGSTFAIAAVTAVLTSDSLETTMLATGCGALAVVSSATLPIPFESDRLTPSIRLAISIVLASGAMALTGGVTSTFTLLPIATLFLAAAGGGLNFAIATAIGAIIGFLGAAGISGTPTGHTGMILIPAMYAITGLAFGEVRRAIVTETMRADNLIVATEAAGSRMARLTAAHELLADLVGIAQSPDMNAVTTAQDAIRDVGVIIPNVPARITTSDGMVLARRGSVPTYACSRRVPVDDTRDPSSFLELWDSDARLTDREVNAVGYAIQPVRLAIDNDRLLQRLARMTIQRERVRLARELHDDIAPSVAAVGLALDMALMSGSLDTEQDRNLSATRSNISRLVDKIRARVEDLRADRSLSVIEMAHSLVAESDADGPTVIVNIDERTPPRPAIAVELGAFMTEAFRNAISHADPTAIWITGRLTEGEGFLAIQDNGRGFDSEGAHDGHFGLVGMQERAAIIMAEFELDSTIGEGTVVSMRWKDDSR